MPLTISLPPPPLAPPPSLSLSLYMAPPPITHWLRHAPLGSGSFGQVSLAINLDDGLFFAVKSTRFAGSPSELCAIERELSILQSLRSPRIVSCFGGDISSENGTPLRNLFLEYMDGGSIAELIKKSGGCLDEARAQCYTRAIVEGLAYLHGEGIVHCDIKGQNILVGSCGVKIADFGAAKKLSENACACECKGTPLWMAPEVVQGAEQGCPSDVWSLGCTVVEMLKGRPPWGEIMQTSSLSMLSVGAILFKIGYSQENPPLPDGVSADCRDFLSKALQRDPKLRWTAAELLNHPWLQGAPEFANYCAQLSPRSTLDFPGDSDADEHDTSGSVPLYSFPRPVERQTCVAYREPCMPTGVTTHASVGENCKQNVSFKRRHAAKLDSDAGIPEDSEWVTVRCAETWLESRQKPFMRKPVEIHVLGEGQAADFVSLAFLRQRRHTG